MERKLICKRCLIEVGKEETKTACLPKKIKLCDSCKKESLALNNKILLERNTNPELRNKNKDRMTLLNPMKNKVCRDKVSNELKRRYQNGEIKSVFSDKEKLKKIREKWKITEEGRESISNRMKLNNPMLNEESRLKSRENFKKKVDSGEIKYKNGPEHHLWRGNRCLNDACRAQLYKIWTYPILARDNFKCCLCEKNTKLQVHHIKPLRDFISESKTELGNIDISNQDNFWKLIQLVISKHKLEDGITVCSKCHAEIDKYYHENKEN